MALYVINTGKSPGVYQQVTRQTVVYQYDGILLCHKNKLTLDICYKMDNFFLKPGQKKKKKREREYILPFT